MAPITFEHVTKRFDETTAVNDLSIEVADGEFLVLVGPSGCGKTTALRMLAGLEDITGGRILIGDRVVNNVAPGARDVAMVFQSYALYPHMTVYDNLAFGLRNYKVPKREIDRRVREAAGVLEMGDLLKRKPKQLSGGQRQRVALGRAIVREPKAFLMDEPLSNLDAKLRVGMRAQLSALHLRLGTTTVYVTHDQVEAMTLGHRVAVMRDGRIQQIDTPQALYNRPTNLFVAAFIGSPAMNLVEADVSDGALEFGGYRIPVTLDRAVPPRVVVGIRPEAFSEAGGASPELPTIEVKVEVVEELGPDTLVIFNVEEAKVDVGEIHEEAGDEEDLLKIEGVHFTARLDPQSSPRPGDRIRLAVDTSRFHYFDPATSLRLEPQHEPAVLAPAQ
jgi:multiple sugar transport system ATP-binding protein